MKSVLRWFLVRFRTAWYEGPVLIFIFLLRSSGIKPTLALLAIPLCTGIHCRKLCTSWRGCGDLPLILPRFRLFSWMWKLVVWSL